MALQMSIREGFCLAVTEALWKATPVVAMDRGGIPLQVLDGYTGYLIDSIDGAVDRMLRLLRRPWEARVLGLNGREHVRRNYLMIYQLEKYLSMMIDLIDGSKP